MKRRKTSSLREVRRCKRTMLTCKSDRCCRVHIVQVKLISDHSPICTAHQQRSESQSDPWQLRGHVQVRNTLFAPFAALFLRCHCGSVACALTVACRGSSGAPVHTDLIVAGRRPRHSSGTKQMRRRHCPCPRPRKQQQLAASSWRQGCKAHQGSGLLPSCFFVFEPKCCLKQTAHRAQLAARRSTVEPPFPLFV
jgi:hypothetical protein